MTLPRLYLAALLMSLAAVGLPHTVHALPTSPIGGGSDSDPYADTLYDSAESFKQSDRVSDGGTTTNGADGSALRRQEEGTRIGRQAGPGNNFIELSDSPMSNQDSPGIARFTGPNTWCKDQGSDCIIPKENLFESGAGEKVAAFSFLSPLSGVTDTLNSRVYVNQVTGNLSSPLSVLAATMNLTEPGLARGMMDSMQVAGMATTARLQADQNVFARAQVYKGTGEIFASAYDSQLALARSNNKSWIEAQSGALGDERITSTGSNFDAPGTTSINFKSDPNHPLSDTMQGAGLGNAYNYDGGNFKENVIRGLDFIFNQEFLRPRAGMDIAQQRESLRALRQSFENFIGDIELKIGPPDAPNRLYPANTSDAGPNSGATGVAVLAIRHIEPHTSSEDFFRQLVIDRFRDIHALLYMRCKFDSNAAGFGTAGSNDLDEMGTAVVGDYNSPSTSKSSFWADFGGAHQLLTRVSTSGFRPSPKVVEALYGMFLDERIDEATPSDCGLLRTENGKASDIFTLLSSKNANERGRYLTANSKERINAAFFLAEHVAFGQFLGTLAQAEKYVKGSTSGSYSTIIKDNLLDLIYGVAGTREISVAMDRNNQELRGLALEMGDRYRQRNSELASSFSESFGQGGRNTSETNNTNAQQ